MREKEYKDFKPSAKKGMQKYARLSSSAMNQYRNKYKKKTGRRASHVDNKEHFYSWVLRNKIK